MAHNSAKVRPREMLPSLHCFQRHRESLHRAFLLSARSLWPQALPGFSFPPRCSPTSSCLRRQMLMYFQEQNSQNINCTRRKPQIRNPSSVPRSLKAENQICQSAMAVLVLPGPRATLRARMVQKLNGAPPQLSAASRSFFLTQGTGQEVTRNLSLLSVELSSTLCSLLSLKIFRLSPHSPAPPPHPCPALANSPAMTVH